MNFLHDIVPSRGIPFSFPAIKCKMKAIIQIWLEEIEKNSENLTDVSWCPDKCITWKPTDDKSRYTLRNLSCLVSLKFIS
jgi:hypothetical protein